jgi:hypothetical protein
MVRILLELMANNCSVNRTLQELMAPKLVMFFDKMWRFVGTRTDVSSELAQVTNIDISLLDKGRDEEFRPPWLRRFSIANRMSWAAKRRTTRPEDIAYCLFGIFGIHLPPLYGEGAKKAFLRLQHEIMKASLDLSILAWSGPRSFRTRPLLANSPSMFNDHVGIEFEQHGDGEPFKITNKGLRVKIPLIINDREENTCTAVSQNCRYSDRSATWIGLRLKRSPHSTGPLEEGRSVWYRTVYLGDKVPTVYSVDDKVVKNAKVYKIYLVT